MMNGGWKTWQQRMDEQHAAWCKGESLRWPWAYYLQTLFLAMVLFIIFSAFTYEEILHFVVTGSVF